MPSRLRELFGRIRKRIAGHHIPAVQAVLPSPRPATDAAKV